MQNCYTQWDLQDTKNTGAAVENYDTGEWGQQIPFSNNQLDNSSGMQMAMPSASNIPSTPAQANDQIGMMPAAQNIIPETLTNPVYTPGYLRTQIGKLMRVEFLIGNSITDRVGILTKVGASYIILQSIEHSEIVCDLFSIKFATIINSYVGAMLNGSSQDISQMAPLKRN